MKTSVLIIFCLINKSFGFLKEFQGFDDNILFSINWPGAPEQLAEELLQESSTTISPKNTEILTVKTSNKEVYNCQIPEIIVNEPVKIQDYEGPSSLQLLKPLFTQKICSYRLESYWSYEVCHGRFIRQYHEERDGKNVKVQEYYLGNWSPDMQIVLEAELRAAKKRQEKPKQTKVNGVALPTLELVMDDGTLCDLSGKPRLTRVQYVCYVHGKHEVYSFKETATCEYEIIILSPLLCEHPQFKPHEATENEINCIPVGDAPRKPRSLLALEAESHQIQLPSSLQLGEKEAKDVVAVFKVEKLLKDGETRLKLELHSLEDLEAVTRDKLPLVDKSVPMADDSPVRAFLNGETCLNGGTGWWKYEFCYGKHVSQYHIDRSGEKLSVQLGRFNKEAHLNWIKENKNKAPKPVDQRTSISHFYANGDICDKTGQPRQTEVKLKCLENSSNPAQVSLYLLEPRICHYILGVESPLICDILPLADENGLIPMAKYSPLTEKITEINLESDTDSEGDVLDKLKNL